MPDLFSRDQKIAAIEHVWYEMYQFFSCGAILAIGHPLNKELKTLMKDCLLECYLLHFRALLYFFQLLPPRDDDIVITHFDSEFKTVDRDTIIAEDDWIRINKDLAHLTYARISRSNENKKWNHLQYMYDMHHVCIEAINSIKQFHPVEEHYLYLNQKYPLETWLTYCNERVYCHPDSPFAGKIATGTASMPVGHEGPSGTWQQSGATGPN